MAPQSQYDRVDRFLSRQLGPLDLKIGILKKKGTSKENAISMLNTSLKRAIDANTGGFGVLGVRRNTPEYDYAVGKASTLVTDLVSMEYDPGNPTSLELSQLYEKAQSSGTMSKSISNKIGSYIGGKTYSAGEVVGGVVAKGARIAGKAAWWLGERL